MNSWLRPALIALVAGIIIGVVGLWGIQRGSRKTLPPIVADTTSALPVYLTDTLYTTITTVVRESIRIPTTEGQTKVETVAVSPDKAPKEPFEITLKSVAYKPILDSVCVRYVWPPGTAYWNFFGGAQNKELLGRNSISEIGLLSIGVAPSFRLRNSKIQMDSYISLRLRRAKVQFGYTVSEVKPSWFLSVRKEWVWF